MAYVIDRYIINSKTDGLRHTSLTVTLFTGAYVPCSVVVFPKQFSHSQVPLGSIKEVTSALLTLLAEEPTTILKLVSPSTTIYQIHMSSLQAPSAMYLTPVFVLLVLLLHAMPSAGGYCHTRGAAGICMPTSFCAKNPGKVSVQNLCPGDYDIQCCVYHDAVTCYAYGKSGKCRTITFCSGTGGTSISGLCPGPSHVQCCIWFWLSLLHWS